MERGAFQKTVSIVRRQDRSKHWEQIRYLIFDAPTLAHAFEDRVEWIERMVDDRSPDFAMPVAHAKCRGIDHLKEELERVEKLGGEGLMLRQPGSKYIGGRSFVFSH